ncbi:hypothetical protein AB0H00_31760, partial [Nocardia sp. NPDC023852]|uniref:hypothetical protein n=1 Tax=Nocardia sp. NPDC023852 TaxID=3154697 RepID=UPI0033D4A40B
MPADSFGDLVATTYTDFGGADRAQPDATTGFQASESCRGPAVGGTGLDDDSVSDRFPSAALATVDRGDLSQQVSEAVSEFPTGRNWVLTSRGRKVCV